jgi:ribonuclease ZC3H12
LSSSNAQPPPLQSHHQQVFDSDASKGSSSSSNNGSVTLGSEARYKLFFHLAAIFPEDQVRQVMTMMPEETNAQKICAAILSLYPKEN